MEIEVVAIREKRVEHLFLHRLYSASFEICLSGLVVLFNHGFAHGMNRRKDAEYNAEGIKGIPLFPTGNPTGKWASFLLLAGIETSEVDLSHYLPSWQNK